MAYGEIPAPGLPDSEHEWSCPWSELEKLTLCLQTRAPESRVQPDLLRRFEQAGFGRLIDVKVERLGHCAGQPFVSGKIISAFYRFVIALLKCIHKHSTYFTIFSDL